MMCLRQLNNKNQQKIYRNRYWIWKYIKYEDEESDAKNGSLLFVSIFSLTGVFWDQYAYELHCTPFTETKIYWNCQTYGLILDSPVWKQEMESMILVGPSQLRKFYDSITVIWEINAGSSKHIYKDDWHLRQNKLQFFMFQKLMKWKSLQVQLPDQHV